MVPLQWQLTTQYFILWLNVEWKRIIGHLPRILQCWGVVLHCHFLAGLQKKKKGGGKVGKSSSFFSWFPLTHKTKQWCTITYDQWRTWCQHVRQPSLLLLGWSKTTGFLSLSPVLDGKNSIYSRGNRTFQVLNSHFPITPAVIKQINTRRRYATLTSISESSCRTVVI